MTPRSQRLSAGVVVVRPTEESRQEVEDFLLAARVEVALAKEGHSVQLDSEAGAVSLISQMPSRKKI